MKKYYVFYIGDEPDSKSLATFKTYRGAMEFLITFTYEVSKPGCAYDFEYSRPRINGWHGQLSSVYLVESKQEFSKETIWEYIRSKLGED